MATPLKVFCCYARQDQKMLEHLKSHLIPLERQGLITIWSDKNLKAGAEWEKELHQHLESADVILLLISPDFLASDYCYGIEMKRAIERHYQGSALVIPILLRFTDWQNSPFAKLQIVPTNAEPVTNWPDRDQAFHNITEQIHQAIASYQNQPNPTSGYRPYGGKSSSQAETRTFPRGQLPAKGKAYSPPGNAQRKIGVIFILIAVGILLVGGAAFALKGLSNQVSQNGQDPLSTRVSSTTSTGVQKTQVKASGTLPTATLSSPRLPLPIPCVGCSYPQLSVTLNRIDMDSPARSTHWVFSFLNNSGSISCSPTFWAIYLTDPDGTNHSGVGRASNGNTFALDVEQSVQLTAVFDVLPASGTQYTLTLQISVGGCHGTGGLNQYQTENFMFA